MKNNIKQLRKQAGLRQEDMANQLGVTRQTIIAIENDKYNPTLELAMKIARLLNKNVAMCIRDSKGADSSASESDSRAESHCEGSITLPGERSHSCHGRSTHKENPAPQH